MVSKNQNNLMIRSLSAALLIPVVMYVILSGVVIFYASVVLISLLMGVEWHGIIKKLKSKSIWNGIALIHILIFTISFCWLRYQENGQKFLLWLVITTWMADTGAFAFGKIIGGPKLAPKISPFKTWAGLIGAVILSGVSGTVFYSYLNFGNGYKFIGATVTLGILAQIGDLFESWIKRKANIKDSGKAIPGHGGILDRVDGLVFSAAGAFVFVMIFKEYLF